MFHMPSEGNKFLGDTNRRYLLAHDEVFIRRNVKGLWGQPEGAIHVVHPSSILPGTAALVEWLKQTCFLVRTFDYGDSAPTCCLWSAVDRNGNVFIFREYYMANAMISTHRGNIAGLSGSEHYEYNLPDPSIFHKMPAKQGGRFCIADEYADCLNQSRDTAIFWKPADNNELGTRNRINEFLRFDPERIHPVTRQPGAAQLFFVKGTDTHPNVRTPLPTGKGFLETDSWTRGNRRNALPDGDARRELAGQSILATRRTDRHGARC
jgi:hypothetical protein